MFVASIISAERMFVKIVLTKFSPTNYILQHFSTNTTEYIAEYNHVKEVNDNEK